LGSAKIRDKRCLFGITPEWEPRGAGLIAKSKAPAMTRQLRRVSPQRRRRVRDLVALAQLPPLARLGKRHRDCVLCTSRPT
jgi:hypothetical protein